YPGVGDHMKEQLRCNQAVRIGGQVECLGQLPLIGGRKPNIGVLAKTLSSQIDQSFRNIDLTLKTAGGKVWSHVYRVFIYALNGMNGKGFEAMVRSWKEWMPVSLCPIPEIRTPRQAGKD
ncbi:hypothetical protein BKA70DRAFT_1104495, partial [Coprinopsis sp. MPI-PUGE-AT-0042]